MKYQWIDEKTCVQISNKLGCEVKALTTGGIVVGYDGDEPIVKQGIELEIEGETPEILEKLDMFLLNLSREGGKPLAERVLDNLVVATINPHKESYKLSVFAGATPEQIDTYIDNDVTNLATARDFLKKLTRVVQLLLKQVKFEG